MIGGSRGSLGRRSALLGASSMGLVRHGRAAERTLHFVPYANLISMDPLWSISIIGLDHAYMTCDQLYGIDDKFVPQPQMAAGHELSDDGLRWRFTLRDGLLFHDGEPYSPATASPYRALVPAGAFGIRMAKQLDEMSVLDDRRFEIRLKRPYAHLLFGLGATTCFIRPERLARIDAFTQITDQTGSGPFRFLPNEFMTGARVVYERHQGYVPRDEKPVVWSGGKMAYFDRVEWHILPDAATAASALQTGEVDWLERPLLDLVPKLSKAPGVTVEQVDPLGFFSILWTNNAAPQFDNPKLRRALLPAINQEDFMAAVVGDQSQFMRTGMGMFTPGTPFASDAGMAVLNGKRDLAAAKALIKESGYKGEKIVLMAPEIPESHAMADIANALFQQLGLNVDYQSVDFGTMSARARGTDPAVQAGWSCYCIGWAGFWPSNPGTNVPLAGVKSNPKMEALKAAWFDAQDLPAQKQVADRMQLQGFDEPPFIPLGQYFVPYAYRSGLTGFVKAPITAMWNVRRA